MVGAGSPVRYGEQMTKDRDVIQTPGSNELFWYSFSLNIKAILCLSSFPEVVFQQIPRPLGSFGIAESLNQG